MMGIRLVSRQNPGSCAPFSDWWPFVADLFCGRYWIADSFDSSPFGGVLWEYGEEALTALCLPMDDALNVAAFKPEAMDQFYRFVVNDWVQLYGVMPQDFDMLTLEHGQNFLTSLERIADPFLDNIDGNCWDIFSCQEEQVRERLSRVDTVLLGEVKRGKGQT